MFCDTTRDFIRIPVEVSSDSIAVPALNGGRFSEVSYPGLSFWYIKDSTFKWRIFSFTTVIRKPHESLRTRPICSAEEGQGCLPEGQCDVLSSTSSLPIIFSWPFSFGDRGPLRNLFLWLSLLRSTSVAEISTFGHRTPPATNEEVSLNHIPVALLNTNSWLSKLFASEVTTRKCSSSQRKSIFEVVSTTA